MLVVHLLLSYQTLQIDLCIYGKVCSQFFINAFSSSSLDFKMLVKLGDSVNQGRFKNKNCQLAKLSNCQSRVIFLT